MKKNNKKSIIIFSALYPPHIGGVDRFVKNISCAFYKLGCKVTVVTSALYNDEGVTIEDGIIIYRLPCFALMNGRFPVIKRNRTFKKLLRKLSESRYDLCMINTRFYILSLFAARFAYKNHIKSFVLDHGSAHLSFGNSFLDFFENFYEHFITWLQRRYCKNYYGVSHDSEIFLEHFHIHAKGTIHNAIDVKEIESIVANSDYDVYSETGLPPDSILVSYVGRLIYRKGILELNEAISRVIEKYPNIYLVYAGDGELSTELARRKSPHTIMLGMLKYEDAIKVIEQSDIFCLASETEGFPTAVLEAAACKTFIITTVGSGGAKELVKSKDYGIMMKDNHPRTIEKAIIRALDEDYRKKAISNCYSEVKNNYSWKGVAEKIIIEDEK